MLGAEWSMLDGEESPAPAGPARPRRVLFMDHTAVLRGGEFAMLNLIRHLDPERYQPAVLLFAPGGLRDRLEEAGIQTHVLPLKLSVAWAEVTRTSRTMTCRPFANHL